MIAAVPLLKLSSANSTLTRSNLSIRGVWRSFCTRRRRTLSLPTHIHKGRNVNNCIELSTVYSSSEIPIHAKLVRWVAPADKQPPRPVMPTPDATRYAENAFRAIILFFPAHPNLKYRLPFSKWARTLSALAYFQCTQNLPSQSATCLVLNDSFASCIPSRGACRWGFQPCNPGTLQSLTTKCVASTRLPSNP